MSLQFVSRDVFTSLLLSGGRIPEIGSGKDNEPSDSIQLFDTSRTNSATPASGPIWTFLIWSGSHPWPLANPVASQASANTPSQGDASGTGTSSAVIVPTVSVVAPTYLTEGTDTEFNFILLFANVSQLTTTIQVRVSPDSTALDGEDVSVGSFTQNVSVVRSPAGAYELSVPSFGLFELINDSISEPTELLRLEIRVAGQIFSNGTDTFIVTIPIHDNEVFVATEGDDIYFGLEATNILYGLGGSDSLTGGPYEDRLYGGEGDDTLNGGDGSDRIVGGGGSDTLNGDSGNDVIYGDDESGSSANAGDDTIDGGEGSDTIYGGDGNDTLSGGEGGDRILGEGGNDLISGGNFDDTLLGGDGDDEMFGDAGFDVMFGGAGNDVLHGGEDIDSLRGEDGDDALHGDAGIDTLVGGNGNDILFGGDENDNLFGGEGADVLHGEAGNDTLRGENGDDVIFGDDGNDLLVGGAGADELHAGNGNDKVFGGIGNDYITGGDGDDNLRGEAGDDEIHGGGGSDAILAGAGNDIVNGDDGSDRIYGEAGDDLMAGGAENDALRGGAGNDSAWGGDGSDILIGDAGADMLYGEDGSDKFFGGDDNDILDGAAGNDIMRGDAGDDTLLGGSGNDTLLGGAGADTFVFERSTGSALDRIKDFAAGTDTIKLVNSGFSTFADVQSAMTVLGAHTIISLPSGDRILIDNILPGGFSAGDFVFENPAAPVFTSGTSASFAENGAGTVYTAVANDPGSGAVTYSLSGTDAALFAINTNSGAVTFLAPPDFETPLDAGGNNIYNIIVSATDGEYVTTRGVAVTVTDVIEPSVIDLTSLSAGQGFIIQGDDEGDFLGWSASSAGDVNGDGFDDVIVGAPDGDDGGNGAGEAYIVFGGSGAFGTDVSGRQVIDLTSLSALQGFVIQGDSANDGAGHSVSAAGDINGDGLADLIIGADGASSGGADAGEAYVVFGTASGFGVDVSGRQVVDISSLGAADGFVIQGDAAGDNAGVSVSSAGDVNGDGFDDLIIGAHYGDDGGVYAGEAYVVFGGSGAFGADVSGRQVVDLSSLGPAQGFVIQGDAPSDFAGISVSSAGDVNGDGFGDMIVGAFRGDDGGSSTGEAYVIFGGAGTFGTDVSGRQVIDLTSLSAARGFIIQGDTNFDGAGYSVSSAGDVNGDGFDDIIVGVGNGDDGGSDAGEAYVVFGGAAALGSSVGGRQVVDLTNLNAAQGFIIQGDTVEDAAGDSVSAAGDVNGDGFSDLIVGARGGDDGGTVAGEAYIVFGGPGALGANVSGRQVIDLTILAATQGFVIQGDDASDNAGQSVSSAGDVNNDGFDDLLVGARGASDGGYAAGEAYIIFGGATGTESTVVVSRAGTGAADNFTGNAGDDPFANIGANDVVRGGAGDDLVSISALSFADISGGRGTDTLALSGAGLALNMTTTPRPAIESVEIVDLTGSGNNSLTLNRLAVQNFTEARDGGVATVRVTGNAGDVVTLTDGGWTQGGNVIEGAITYASYSNGNARLLVQTAISISAPGLAELPDTSGKKQVSEVPWIDDEQSHTPFTFEYLSDIATMAQMESSNLVMTGELAAAANLPEVRLLTEFWSLDHRELDADFAAVLPEPVWDN